jgi:signal transduction histidine kinase
MQTLSVVRQGDGGTQHYLSLSTDITDLKEQQNLQNTNAHLHALAERAQDVREEQNAHIAREIHDVLAQELTLVKIDLALLSRYLHTPVTEATRALLNERTADATRQVDQAIQTVKNIATALRPAILDSLGLFAAIGWLVEDFCKRSGLAFEVSVPEDTPMPDRKLSIALFRIVQESLTNVARHAKATKVTLRLAQSPESLTLTVQDDGCGISPTQTADKLSIGLAGMQERAMAFGGTFTVLGSPGAGTTVSVHIPMKEPT